MNRLDPHFGISVDASSRTLTGANVENIFRWMNDEYGRSGSHDHTNGQDFTRRQISVFAV